MNIKIINDYLITYQRQGNDRNGHPIYIINVFIKYYPCSTHGMTNTTDYVYSNYNYTISNNKKIKLDKYGNIKVTSYNIDEDIKHLITYNL